MKHIGSKIEFTDERDRDLLRAYKSYIATCDVIRIDEVSQAVAKMPSSKFWVSVDRAAIVVARILLHADTLPDMRPLKRDMFMEIARRVKEILSQKEMPIYEACIKVLQQPAPQFYMTPLSVRTTIYKIKKQCKAVRKN